LEDAVKAVIMLGHLGAAHLKSGAVDKSASDYQRALAAVEPMAATNPDNVEVLYAMADTYSGLGDVEMAQAERSSHAGEKSGHLPSARGWYEKSLSTWQKIPRVFRLSPSLFRAGNPQLVGRNAAHASMLVSQN
jgi:tetratricopeptide (TPR) repeat protein